VTEEGIAITQPESNELLSVFDISTVGAVILDALGRLKHMGAIAEAHSGFSSLMP
jgi:hypothetical protein